MKEPTFDIDGDITYATAVYLRNFDNAMGDNQSAYWNFVYKCFDIDYGSFSYVVRDNMKLITMVTGGWSSNENVINCIMGNYLVNTVNWVLSRRGGYYEFEIKEEFDWLKELNG